jgi:predicted SAM-dependent methyltransferase
LKTLLHVGCGFNSLEQLPAFFRDGQWEEVRYDIDPAVRPDIVGSLQDMSLIEDGCIDAICSAHNIEHVWAFEVPAVLSEFRRVLRPDGVALIMCPDLMAVAEAVLAGYLEKTVYEAPAGPITAMDILYGYQSDIAKGRHYMAHKTGFTADTLGAHLLAAGFAAVTVARDRVMGLHAVAHPEPPDPDLAGRLFEALVPYPDHLVQVVHHGTLRP